jgi:hypothetical protein
VSEISVDVGGQLILGVWVFDHGGLTQGFFPKLVSTFRTMPSSPPACSSMSQAIFVVRAKQVSGPGIIYRMWSRCHNSLGSLRIFLFIFYIGKFWKNYNINVEKAEVV